MNKCGWILTTFILAIMMGCSDDCPTPAGRACSEADPCPSSAECVKGYCQPLADATLPNDANVDAQMDATDADAMSPDSGADATNPCADCPEATICRFGQCVPDLGACENHIDCPGDSYCSDDGECIPYGTPGNVTHDPTCRREALPPAITPKVQCSGATDRGQVYTTPIVADLNLDLDANRLQPSVIFSAWKLVNGVRTSVLYVHDGRTCEEQIVFGDNEADRPGAMTQIAVADLDGDVITGGHPEIIAFHRVGEDARAPLQLYALDITVTDGVASLSRKWTGRNCDTDTPITLGNNLYNFAPGVWDLNNDTRPEVVVDSYVFDNNGCVLNNGNVIDYLSLGQVSAVADVDLDGKQELVLGTRIAEWDEVTTEWIDEDYFDSGRSYRDGFVAIADVGQYSALPGMPTPNDLPEVIVVSAASNEFDLETNGTIRVQSLSGETIFGPVTLRHDRVGEAGHGGPPTAADFDGDGQIEFAAAANEYFAVYDPDCDPALNGANPSERPGGNCVRPTDEPTGILWAKRSRDASSGVTGSSVFDFNGDGRAEAVYSDECFVRVYDGPSGNVIYSASATNGTGFEYPTIADVDGDFSTEIIVPKGDKRGECPDRDPIFAGETLLMVEGGFSILHDPEDRWANSRPVWNQHAYSINNVSDNVTVPISSERQPNWTTEGLNNFRQNSQGSPATFAVADLTVSFDVVNPCQPQDGIARQRARVCNRGSANAPDGIQVDFVDAASIVATPNAVVCSAQTDQILAPGECAIVFCDGEAPNNERLFVRVDPQGLQADCHPTNNNGISLAQHCLE